MQQIINKYMHAHYYLLMQSRNEGREESRAFVFAEVSVKSLKEGRSKKGWKGG
jgi:hypothetical protein